VTDDERSDAEILLALRTQPDLVGVLYERHAAAVFRFVARRAGAPVAEDLLSDVFVSALAARKRVFPHTSGSALPWLYGIASNVVRRHLRRTHLPWRSLRDAGMDWDAVDARIDAEAQRAQLRVALNALSRAERDVLLLVGWDGLTTAEASEALGISPVAARSRLHRARQRVHRALNAGDPEQASDSGELDQLVNLLHSTEELA
jgi:RNA polymerase sigma factor (sigma-70 family)